MPTLTPELPQYTGHPVSNQVTGSRSNYRPILGSNSIFKPVGPFSILAYSLSSSLLSKQLWPSYHEPVQLDMPDGNAVLAHEFWLVPVRIYFLMSRNSFIQMVPVSLQFSHGTPSVRPNDELLEHGQQSKW